jgi:hypothetical protein
MKRMITMLAIAGLCSTGAVLAAQAPAPAAPAKSAKKADAATQPAKADKMAKEPKAAATAYTGCVAEGTKKGSYVLNDATATGSTDKANYDLKGGSLKAHVGHKVEVTGAVTKPATGNSVLAVKKVKMVAASCA